MYMYYLFILSLPFKLDLTKKYLNGMSTRVCQDLPLKIRSGSVCIHGVDNKTRSKLHIYLYIEGSSIK